MDHTNRIHAKWNMNDMSKNNQRSRIDKKKLPEHPKRIFTRLSWKKSMRNIAILPFGNICSQARADNWKTITFFLSCFHSYLYGLGVNIWREILRNANRNGMAVCASVSEQYWFLACVTTAIASNQLFSCMFRCNFCSCSFIDVWIENSPLM